jgi:hypothetical protein
MAKDDPRRALDRWKGYRNGEVFFFYSYTKKGLLGKGTVGVGHLPMHSRYSTN